MRFQLLLGTIASLGVAGLSTAASAGEWTGGYVGGSVGVDAIEHSLNAVTPRTGDSPIVTEGWIGGDLGASVMAGYDRQLSPYLVGGVMLTYDWSSIETAARASAGGRTASAKLLGLDDGYSVAGRIGVLAAEDTFLYALGGYAWVGFDDLEAQSPNFTFRHELPEFSGAVVGAGIEHRLSGNLSLRAEYRQVFLGEELAYGDPVAGTFRAEPTLHMARVGAAYRFGAGADEPTAMHDTAGGSLAQRWDGVHIAAGGALTAFTRDLKVESSVLSAEAELTGLGGGSITLGGTAGYDVAVADRWLVGVFGGYDEAAIESSVRVSQDGEWGEFDLLNVGSAWTAGARLSHALSEDALIYALLGYTWLTPGAFDIDVSNGISIETKLPDLEGLTAGLGFEQRLTGYLTARAEYRYTAYDEHDFRAIAPVTSASLDAEQHAVRLELAIRPEWP